MQLEGSACHALRIPSIVLILTNILLPRDMSGIVDGLQRKAFRMNLRGARREAENLRRIRQAEAEAILSLVPRENRGIMLDVGCGLGYQSRFFRDFFRDVISADLNKNGESGSVDILCRVESLPFEGSLADCVLLSNVLEHVWDRDTAIRECIRVVKDDGAIVITVPSVIWKVFSMVGYYFEIARILTMAESDCSSESCSACSPVQTAESQCNERSLTEYLLPLVHGSFSGNLDELLSYRVSFWKRLFTKAGMVDVVAHKLPLYPFRFIEIEPLRKILERIGFSSSSCFVIRQSVQSVHVRKC